jgi:SAM-dependent methyltransferase
MVLPTIITILFELLGIVILLIVIYFLGRPIIRGAIYFPTTPRGTKNMMKLAEVGPGQSVVDLGSGDGRIVIACAELGARAVGYEINPILARRSRDRVKKVGLEKLASIYWESFWRVDLSEFDTIIVYGIPYIMADLQKKFARELKPGTKILSNAFPFPGWKPIASEGKIHLYIWPVAPTA